MADFDEKVLSAVGEAFNNVALHGYGESSHGEAKLEFEIQHDKITIRLFDTGKGFDPSAEGEPDLESLPESHMGLVIIRDCMDEVSYSRGKPPNPNVLTLSKRYLISTESNGELTSSDSPT